MARLLEFAANNPLLVAATLAMVIAAVAFEWRVRARGVFEVTIPQAVRLINNGAAVVDVREPARFESGHIVDAINMSLDEVAKAQEGKLKKKRGVLVVCDSGSQSFKAAEALRRAGFEGVFSLQGGLTAWQRENQVLVAGKR